MPNSNANRNMLFGILAVQLDFISRDALIEAMNAWVLEKSKPLGAILVAQGELQSDTRELLEALVEKHLKQHGGDADKSLKAVSSVGSLHETLANIQDRDIEASLAHMATAPRETDPYATQPSTVGEATSAGVRFRILRPHAKGGLGQISVALDTELKREVALKELQEHHADHVESRSRFTLEAEITGGLEHPGIVLVYGLGTYADGRPFYAMRFIRVDSLKGAIERFHKKDNAPLAPSAGRGAGGEGSSAGWRDDGERTLELRKLLQRFIDVCNAIEYAHSRGVLHRDLKPGNIMLGKYGETLVVDWGLAKAVGKTDQYSGSDERTLRPSSGSGSTPTLAGQAIGTPAFMSPEQAAGRLEELGPRSDVYSLGATLYSLLTGQAPFSDTDLGMVLAHVQLGEFPRPREIKRDVPAPLEAICLKAMALKPPERYATPDELASEVEHWLADEPVSAHRESTLAKAARWARKHRAWAMSGAAALALVAVVATVFALLINAQKQVIAKQERETTQLAEREKSARAKADLNAKTAVRQTELAKRHLYVAHMNLAQAAWEDARVAAVLELLMQHEPKPGIEDLRGFEWHYWNRLSHTYRLNLKGHKDPIWSVAFSPDGQRLASACVDGTVKLWDAGTGQDSLTLRGHTAPVTSVAFSPDGQRLASASYDQTIKMWDPAMSQESLTLKGHTGIGHVTSVAFSASGQRLASASDDQTVKVWDATTGQELHTLKGHTAEVPSVAFSRDGKRLASASYDKTVKLWDAATGEESLTLKGHTDLVNSVAFSPDGQWLASASGDFHASQPGEVKVWDAATGRESLTLKGHTSYVDSVAFSPDGHRLASASDDQTVKVWDAAMGLDSLTLKGHTGGVSSVAFSPDGKRLASASYDQTVKVWDADAGQESLTLKGHAAPVNSVAFSPDGLRLASASWDGTVKVWDATPRQEDSGTK